MAEDDADFFVSHAGADRAWAEWVAWQLTDAGYSVVLDVWDWPTGRNFVASMSDALDRCDRVVALLSAEYFDRSRYTTDEWTSALLHLPGWDSGRLVPVRVEEVPPHVIPAMLRPLLFCDVFGLDADEARRVLLAAVAAPGRPDGVPAFPGTGGKAGRARLGGSGPRLPGSLPRVWNIPARNPAFTGRDALLAAIRDRLVAGDRAVVQAFEGMGGVGKTQLAAEYAYRFAGTYDLAWWISSEKGGLIGDQFAALGAALRCVQSGASAEEVRHAVLGELRERGQWLLIFDNAEDPGDVRPWLPGGSGHVLITSRERRWAEIAAPVEVDVMSRAESVAVLQNRVPGLGTADADMLAGLLGDLPLAVAQAAGFMAETGMPPAQYSALLPARAARLLSHGAPGSYPRSLAAATQLIADRLDATDPAAGELARLCAFLAPEPIPESLFTSAASELPGELGARAADPLAWRQTLAQLARQALARIDNRGLQIHRLTQAILRDLLTPEDATAARERAEAILAANDPAYASNPMTWPVWSQLMPHLLVADLAGTENPGLRGMACHACGYLLFRGDTRAGYDLAHDLRRTWRERRGDDDEHTQTAASYMAWALRNMGRYAEARDLDQDTFERHRRILGPGHHSTLASAGNLAANLRELGDAAAARKLDQDALDRRRQELGPDAPYTLVSANNLAADLRQLGQLQAARDLDQDTLDRRRKALGADHPDTLTSANNLAADLRQLGQPQAARKLDQDTLDRRRRILGTDHHSTLASANGLALDLRALGEYQAALELDDDTLTRRRRVLGEDHPYTRQSASNVAADRSALGTASDNL